MKPYRGVQGGSFGDRLVKVQSSASGGNCARNPVLEMPMRDHFQSLKAVSKYFRYRRKNI